MKNSIVAVLVSSALLAGCSDTWSTGGLDPAPGAVAPEVTLKTPSDVVLTDYATVSGQTHRVVGELKVMVHKTSIFDPAPTREAVEAKLREEAAAGGADAVVNVRIVGPFVSLLSWATMEGTGIAVAFD